MLTAGGPAFGHGQDEAQADVLCACAVAAASAAVVVFPTFVADPWSGSQVQLASTALLELLDA